MRVVECHRCGCVSLRPFLVTAVLLASTGACCRMAAGQAAPANPAAPPPSFRELPIDTNAKTLKTQASRLLRSEQLGQNEQTILDQYYRGCVLARWSLVAEVAQLARYRSELQRRVLEYSDGYPAHDYLVNLVLTQMREFAKGNFHPFLRHNAMLVIGELNAVEVKPRVSPTPLPEALKDLLEAVADPQQLETVKIAALTGVARHTRLGGIRAPADRTAVTGAMLSVLGAPAAAANGSSVGLSWMRGQAAEVLGLLGAVGNNGAVATAVAGVVADSELSLMSSRCLAAEALGKLDYQGATGLNAAQLARALGQLAVDIYKAEAEASAASSRRLRGRLVAVSTGLNGSDAQHKGVAALATAGQQFVATLRRSLASMLDHAADDQMDTRQKMQRIGQEANNLESELSKAALATN